MTLEFELPGLPKTTNGMASWHWRKKGDHAANWKRSVFYAVMGKKPKEPLSKARLTLHRFSSFQPDADGLVSSFKHVIDGLIAAGVLVNDRYENIGMPTYVWSKVKPLEGKISVKVEWGD